MIYTNSIFDVIGADRIVDQYEVEYYSQYSGSYTDDVVTGSLILYQSVSGSGLLPKTIVVTGSRGWIASQITTESPNVRLSATDLCTAYTPKRDLKGSLYRMAQFHDYRERFYDTLLPSLSEIWMTDGIGVYDSFLCSHTIRTDAATGFSTDVPAACFYMGDIYDPREWYVIGGNNISVPGDGKYSTLNITNLEWPRAYPWEPRYSSLPRYTSALKSITSTKVINWPTSPAAATQTNCKIPRKSAYIAVHGMTPFVMARLEHVVRLGLNAQSYSSVDRDLNSPDYDQFASTFTDEREFIKAGYGYSTYDGSPRRIGDYVPDVTVGGYIYYKEDILGTISPPPVHFQGAYVAFSGSTSPHPSGQWFRHAMGLTVSGWKYGILNGFRQTTKSVFRRDKFGQFRDMLEQRMDGKFFYETVDPVEDVMTSGSNLTVTWDRGPAHFQNTVTAGPVQVKFLDVSGTITKPQLTYSSNQSLEATSSLPYFDGEPRNRPTINESLIDVVMVTS